MLGGNDLHTPVTKRRLCIHNDGTSVLAVTSITRDNAVFSVDPTKLVRSPTTISLAGAAG